jgi:hypothetical protein
MATMLDLDGERLEALRAAFSGSLLGAADVGYDEARRIHNGLIDRRPALIARCHGAADVADAVKLARESGLEISVRGGGRCGTRRRRRRTHDRPVADERNPRRPGGAHCARSGRRALA